MAEAATLKYDQSDYIAKATSGSTLTKNNLNDGFLQNKISFQFLKGNNDFNTSIENLFLIFEVGTIN